MNDNSGTGNIRGGNEEEEERENSEEPRDGAIKVANRRLRGHPTRSKNKTKLPIFATRLELVVEEGSSKVMVNGSFPLGIGDGGGQQQGHGMGEPSTAPVYNLPPNLLTNSGQLNHLGICIYLEG